MQVMIDGAPYLILGGELHNSSPSSPAYMVHVWEKLAHNKVRTVIGAASWELIEPEEGRFDFAAVDDQIRQARKHGVRLVMIWFGAYKNAESTYAPTWVRRDEARFPRAERDPNAKPQGIAAVKPPAATLSLFGDRLVEADARAFAALMRHIRSVDRQQTAILVQVENEVGLLGDSRDRSALALAAWSQPVPAELTAGPRRAAAAGARQGGGRKGFRPSGTWQEVFGDDKAANEIFMAWGFARYVDRVARAGLAALWSGADIPDRAGPFDRSSPGGTLTAFTTGGTG